jgi:hypothetical protein
MSDNWDPAEPDLATVKKQYPDPLKSLARTEIPAIVLRKAFDPEQGYELIDRFLEQGLMDDANAPNAGQMRKRIDIGTSLGNRGSDKEDFLQHSAKTLDLFATLFEGFDDPVDAIYDSLSALAVDKDVIVAREPDGRLYGPAIFRIHYTSHSYKPHIDHVTLREKRFDYAVSRFEHQFAGVLCLQNTSKAGDATQSIMHRCLWTEEVQPHIDNETFPAYAKEKEIPHFRADLEPGDLYFFNTRLIHEVPALGGTDPRIVLAVFIGYSEDDGEIFVWS